MISAAFASWAMRGSESLADRQAASPGSSQSRLARPMCGRDGGQVVCDGVGQHCRVMLAVCARRLRALRACSSRLPGGVCCARHVALVAQLASSMSPSSSRVARWLCCIFVGRCRIGSRPGKRDKQRRFAGTSVSNHGGPGCCTL